jgi:hypothetical protein
MDGTWMVDDILISIEYYLNNKKMYMGLSIAMGIAQ